jgi:hypothetical protein
MARSGPGEIEVYRSADGSKLAVIAATWHLNPKVTFAGLASEFERDEALAWRNYACIVKGGVDTDALRDKEVINRHANRSRLHPWDEENQEFYSWFRPDPGAEYYVHIDLAKNHDSAGIALGHIDRRRGVIVIDLMHAVRSMNGRDIQIADVRKTFVYDLTARGFHIACVSYDQWQSLESQQQLASRGYKVIEKSADKTKEPYDTLIDLIKTASIDYYLHPQFVREMQKLKKFDRKYDHPADGSKDVSDAVACVCSNLLENELENPYTGSCKLTVVRQPAHSQKPGWD